MICVLRWKLCLIKWEKKKIENSKDCPSLPRYPNASRRTTWENGIAIERLCFTFTPNGKREFVPRDQDFHLLVIYCSLSLNTNLLFYTIFFLRGGAIHYLTKMMERGLQNLYYSLGLHRIIIICNSIVFQAQELPWVLLRNRWTTSFRFMYVR